MNEESRMVEIQVTWIAGKPVNDDEGYKTLAMTDNYNERRLLCSHNSTRRCFSTSSQTSSTSLHRTLRLQNLLLALL
jgi:hypothetical protein